MQVSVGVPASQWFDPWALGFKQSSLRRVSQPLRELLGYPNFASLRFIDMLCSQVGFLSC
jgi:hypothetical protein